MTGIYIHIPFCKSRCIYCAFYSTTDPSLRQRYIDALCREMEMRPANAPVETVYIGGGTPSQLSPAQLQQLFIYIDKVYTLHPSPEITIEVNPDDVTAEYAAVLQQLPVNRVSMGAQTFDDRRLRTVREIKSHLLDHGALGAVMTGTGSAVFGVFRPGTAPEGAAAELRREYGFCEKAVCVGRQN